jgi:hypothetical protein
LASAPAEVGLARFCFLESEAGRKAKRDSSPNCGSE